MQKYKKQIANSSRRYLRNLVLPPLVIVDTNILFSALIDKIANRLELASETSIDLLNQDNFHKVLSSKAEAGKIKLWLPNIVKHELKEIAKSANKIRAKFSNSMVRPELLDKMLEKDEILKKDFTQSLKQEQKKFGIHISGGDTVFSNKLSFTIISVGFSSNIIFRNKAKFNDDIYVTGNLGDSYMGLRIIKKKNLL